MTRKRKMPRDANQRAKMIVDMTLHEDEPVVPARVKDPASVELGRQRRAYRRTEASGEAQP